MIDTYTDGMGFLDFQRSQHGSGMSSRSQAKKFIALLQRTSDRTYNTLFSVQEMRQIAKVSDFAIPFNKELWRIMRNMFCVAAGWHQYIKKYIILYFYGGPGGFAPRSYQYLNKTLACICRPI